VAGFVTNMLERICQWPGLNYYPGMRLEGVRKSIENLSHNSRCLGQDSNWAPLECQDALPLEISLRANFYKKIGQQYRTLYCVPAGILSETRKTFERKKFRTNVVKKNTTHFMPNTLFSVSIAIFMRYECIS
jgi:hypothetical protein